MEGLLACILLKLLCAEELRAQGRILFFHSREMAILMHYLLIIDILLGTVISRQVFVGLIWHLLFDQLPNIELLDLLILLLLMLMLLLLNLRIASFDYIVL